MHFACGYIHLAGKISVPGFRRKIVAHQTKPASLLNQNTINEVNAPIAKLMCLCHGGDKLASVDVLTVEITSSSACVNPSRFHFRDSTRKIGVRISKEACHFAQMNFCPFRLVRALGPTVGIGKVFQGSDGLLLKSSRLTQFNQPHIERCESPDPEMSYSFPGIVSRGMQALQRVPTHLDENPGAECNKSRCQYLGNVSEDQSNCLNVYQLQQEGGGSYIRKKSPLANKICQYEEVIPEKQHS
ncbi:hypothetical protein C8R44DRAFT_746691 [Mycena epipterygia]|nr:hypothetical protein C8R44DRAFT_746691 [Mycena epipterygia]